MVILCFNINKELIIDGVIYKYSEDILSQIILQKEIYVVTYPGSYTGIRKSIAIVKAIEILNPEITIYGINLLKDFAIFFSPIVFFAEKHIIHIYNSITKEISISFDFDHIFSLSPDMLGNISNTDGKFIDFSLLNIYLNINRIEKHPVNLEYYDKFTN